MPIGFDPNDTVPVKLDCFDGNKPDDQRATFTCRHLTSKQVKEVARLRREAHEAKTYDEQDAKLNAALLVGIVGWDNLRDDKGELVPFSPEAFDEFSFLLKSDMAGQYPDALMFSEIDQKKSSSHSKPASTAAPGATAPGSAGTAPA
jgi:hypothetical protein